MGNYWVLTQKDKGGLSILQDQGKRRSHHQPDPQALTRAAPYTAIIILRNGLGGQGRHRPQCANAKQQKNKPGIQRQCRRRDGILTQMTDHQHVHGFHHDHRNHGHDHGPGERECRPYLRFSVQNRGSLYRFILCHAEAYASILGSGEGNRGYAGNEKSRPVYDRSGGLPGRDRIYRDTNVKTAAIPP